MIKFDKNYKKILLYLIVFILLIIIYSVSMVITCSSFGHNNVTDFNYQSTAYGLDVEGDYPDHFNIRFDNFTDSLMINIAWFSSYDNPFVTAFAGRYYDDAALRKVEDLKVAVYDSSIEPNMIYPRYWHGYIIILKPLLTIHEYHEIRRINALIFYLLFALSSALILKKLNCKVFIAYIVALITVDIHVVPMSLQFTTDFLLTFIAVIVILYIPKNKPFIVCLTFFIIGSVTMFFDFYTYPYMTLGFPLVVLIAQYENDNEKIKNIIRTTLICCGVWLLGYISTWAARNVISYFILGPQVFKDLFTSVSTRLHVTNDLKLTISRFYRTLKLCYDTYMKYEYLLIVYPIVALWAVLFVLFREKVDKLKYKLTLFVPFLFTVIWLGMAYNPISIHYWFQYRGISVCVFIGFYIILSTIDYSKVRHFPIKLKERYIKFNKLKKKSSK